MAQTIKGFQGTMTDGDWAAPHFLSLAPTVGTPGDLLVTAVGGARSVSVAPGTANGNTQFVRSAWDTAQTLALTPPTSGGKWYLIAVKRQWSPINSVVIEAVDTGVTTDGTVPTKIPVSTTVPGYLLSTPGTAAGAHQGLALVHVRAADTTLTIADIRLVATRSGGLMARTLHAIAWHAPLLPDGGEIEAISALVPSTTTANGLAIISGRFRKVGALMYAIGSIETSNLLSGSTIASLLADLASTYSTVIAVLASTGVIDGGNTADPALTWRFLRGAWVIVPSETTFVARRNLGTSASIPGGSWTAIPWDTDIADLFGMKSGTDNRAFIVPWSGRWHVRFKVAISTSAVAPTVDVVLAVAVYNSGVTALLRELTYVAHSGHTADDPYLFEGDGYLNAGEVIFCRVLVRDGTTRGVTFPGNSPAASEMELRYTGAV